MEGGATILHADLDAFYASVEQLLNPSLRGRPIAVGGGVVLAASYEARAFGVRGGMPGRQARELCPRLQFVPGHFGEYQRLADRVVDVFADFTPAIERISIDEAFLEVAGATRLFGPPVEIAGEIRRRVRDEIGLAVSVGIAGTKHLAKIASQVAKPDGLVVVEPHRELEFLHPLPVELVWGVGPVTRTRLSELGIFTIGDLASAPGRWLERRLGHAAGSRLGSLALNHDPRRVQHPGRAGSVGAQSALGRKPASGDLVSRVIRHLADRVGGRLRRYNRAARTVTARVRFANLRAVTRSITLPAPISATPTIANVAVELVHGALADHPDERDISLLAVSLSHLTYESALQLELPLALGNEARRPGTEAGAALWALDRAVDAVRTRYGRHAVGYTSVVLMEATSVPDEFRELAERPDDPWEGRGG